MSKVINDHKRMSELYGLLADGRELELLSTNGEWFDSAANDNPKQVLSIYIEYRVKPVTYSQAFDTARHHANHISGDIHDAYTHMFDSGMDFQANREDK